MRQKNIVKRELKENVSYTNNNRSRGVGGVFYAQSNVEAHVCDTSLFVLPIIKDK